MGVMQTESIITTLLAAAAFLKKPIQDVAYSSVKDAYEAAKHCLRRKLGETSDAATALDLAAERPDSETRKAMLLEETRFAGIEADAELAQLINEVATRLPLLPVGHPEQHLRSAGRDNRGQGAGRDLIIGTEKHVRRNVITPDDRHLNVAQRDTIRSIIAEVAEKLADGDGDPNFAAVHRMMQRRYGVVSYLLIPHDRFDDALSFLKQQRAIYRSRLRRRNPAAYQKDFYRAIYTGVGKLGWDRSRIYEFATEKLALKKPLTSLKQLGPNQLKSLADAMRNEVVKTRAVSFPVVSGGGASEKR
jgi:hypothetical protein